MLRLVYTRKPDLPFLGRSDVIPYEETLPSRNSRLLSMEYSMRWSKVWGWCIESGVSSVKIQLVPIPRTRLNPLGQLRAKSVFISVTS